MFSCLLQRLILAGRTMAAVSTSVSTTEGAPSASVSPDSLCRRMAGPAKVRFLALCNRDCWLWWCCWCWLRDHRYHHWLPSLFFLFLSLSSSSRSCRVSILHVPSHDVVNKANTFIFLSLSVVLCWSLCPYCLLSFIVFSHFQGLLMFFISWTDFILRLKG